MPEVAKPLIAYLNVNKKKIVIDGLGFAKGASVIEVNSLSVPVTEFDDTYRLGNGTYTRVTASLGKSGIKNFFPSKIETPVTVFNSATGKRSDPQYFKR